MVMSLWPRFLAHPVLPTCSSTGSESFSASKHKLKRVGQKTGKFALKLVLKIPPHLACVATLYCETLIIKEM